jgi:hypothetical protein
MGSTEVATCRLCGCAMRGSDHVVRVGGDLLHLACAEPALGDSPTWAQREIGTLNQLAAGVGRASGVAGP